MSSSAAQEYEYAEYFSPSGAIACLVLYRTEQLTFVRFRTADWEGYDGFSFYATTAIFPEHLRPADPQSPGVMNFVQALASEAAAQQRYVSNCRHQANEQSKQEGAPTPKTCATVTQGDGVKPSPKPTKTPASQRKARAGGEAVHSLKPVRTIAGLTLADFLYDR